METRARERRPGRRIGGRYRLGDRIGRGGMATVYRATDEQLGRQVALKVMHAELGTDPQFVRRFAAEARRAASVVHPNVVAVYDVGVDPRPYMVMELVARGDLADLLRHEVHLEPAHAARVVADAADAVSAAHAAGLVHRDVKPGNILIGSDGGALVADFGIARATGEESMTRTGAALGSVDYFSPEQARGERAGSPSDVYALGVVLFELLTGRRPFSGDTPYAIATARLGAPVPDPRSVLPSLPAGLAKIAIAAMATDAGDRPTADELSDRLRRWLEAAEAESSATPRAAIGTAIFTPPVGAARDGSAKDARAASVPDSALAAPQQRVGTATSAEPATRPHRPRPSALLLLIVALSGLAAVGFVIGSLIVGTREGDPRPGILVGSPGGDAIDTSTPSLTPIATPNDTHAPTPTPSLPATLAPVTPAPATPAPAIAPAPPQRTPAPVVAGPPDDTVATFYTYVESGRFDEAHALWTDRMKAEYPRQGNLDDRFADTADITFSALFIAEQSGDRATVQANFTETYDSGGSRDFVGYWQLVRINGRWLLDRPTY